MIVFSLARRSNPLIQWDKKRGQSGGIPDILISENPALGQEFSFSLNPIQENG